jgi:hypothetical protein|tara:strand:- start:147 stop:356 length:210 start_codon:yes stop_codon:yes gene_type:complete
MKDGKWWTYWTLQKVIKERTGTFYGEPSISAAIRNLRKEKEKNKYGLPDDAVIREKITNQKGYKYKLRT